MGALEFLCDVRFHKSYTLPPNPEAGRDKPYHVSYADYGDPNSNAVVLFCGALMGTRFCYSPLDQLAKAHNVRIIHPDRPGIGGSDAVDLEKRVQVWLEMVPQLLAHLGISHISLASHSGGVIYLINTMLTYPYLLHPQNPYVTFFAPWVHQSHSKVMQMRATEWLPAPLIGNFANLLRFLNDNVNPLTDLSGSLVQGIRDSLLSSSTTPAPVPLTPSNRSFRSRAPSISSRETSDSLDLDDPDTVDELRKHINAFLFAESMDGISADAQLFLKKRSIPWCSSSIFWSDLDYVVPLLSKIIDEEDNLDGSGRKWTIDAFHADEDNMVGERGQQWFDECWSQTQSTTKSYEYNSEVIEGTEHNFLMDPAFGASELWFQRVRESFYLPPEDIQLLPATTPCPIDSTKTDKMLVSSRTTQINFEDEELSISTRKSNERRKSFRFFLRKFRDTTRRTTSRRPTLESRQGVLISN